MSTQLRRMLSWTPRKRHTRRGSFLPHSSARPETRAKGGIGYAERWTSMGVACQLAKRSKALTSAQLCEREGRRLHAPSQSYRVHDAPHARAPGHAPSRTQQQPQGACSQKRPRRPSPHTSPCYLTARTRRPSRHCLHPRWCVSPHGARHSARADQQCCYTCAPAGGQKAADD